MSQLNVDTIVSRTGGSPTFSQGAVFSQVLQLLSQELVVLPQQDLSVEILTVQVVI